MYRLARRTGFNDLELRAYQHLRWRQAGGLIARLKAQGHRDGCATERSGSLRGKLQTQRDAPGVHIERLVRREGKLLDTAGGINRIGQGDPRRKLGWSVVAIR